MVGSCVGDHRKHERAFDPIDVALARATPVVFVTEPIFIIEEVSQMATDRSIDPIARKQATGAKVVQTGQYAALLPAEKLERIERCQTVEKRLPRRLDDRAKQMWHQCGT